jgi:Alpha-L-arabinofuranosidase C-terminal domain/Concanavalin A-like lectin/glucanases superfamily/Carbohydrate binding domain
MKPSRFYRLIASSWRRLALAPAALFAVGLLHAQTVPNHPTTTTIKLPEPLTLLSFDEGTGIYAADSVGDHPATLMGQAGWVTGLVGPFALGLPGLSGSYADIASTVVDTTQSFSVAAWVKLNNTNGYQTFVSEDTPGGEAAFFLQLRADTGQFSFTVPYDFFVNPQSLFTPVAGQWYHLAGVYDANAHSATIYVNGILTDQILYVTPTAASGHSSVGRGQFGGGMVDWNNDSIDDVRFYQTALTAPQVLQVAQIGNPSLAGPPPVEPATLHVDVAHPGAQINPAFHGLMIEEISHALDGGLYGELIQNRVFQNDPNVPVNWAAVQENGGAGSIALDTTQPITGTVLTTSLKVSVTQAGKVGAANDGYWGIPVKPNTSYNASFYAKASGMTGPLNVSIESIDGSVVYAQAQVPTVTTDWVQYNVTLATGAVASTENTRFVISAGTTGTLWLNQVSLFPPTYNQRSNGNRIDLMRLMAGLNPGFLRFPGGNYLEGETIAQRFEWKNTIGPISQRPGHESPWGYRSDDGLGLLEFLEWCEDLKMQPLLAVYAGYSLDGEFVSPGPDLQPYVQDALDEIQYITGSTSTQWGAQRAADGHPAPFPLTYIEVGNEDFFDTSGSYDGRFMQFFNAIRQNYPNLKIIATATVTSSTPDIYDQHFYATPRSFEQMVHQYDNYSRTAPKIFVGEYASQEGRPVPDLNAALGDAAWLTGLERNADVVLLESYAPMFVNINPGASQWPTNLIGYDALHSYGSPSYYAKMMFNQNGGTVVLPTTLTTTGGSISRA